MLIRSPRTGAARRQRSGGGVWIPTTRCLRRDRRRWDTVDEACKYDPLRIIGEHAPAAKIDAYIDRGPEALMDYLDCPLRPRRSLRWVKDHSDYLTRGQTRRTPRWEVGGASKPFRTPAALGADLDNLRPQCRATAAHAGCCRRLPADEHHRHPPPQGHRRAGGQGRLCGSSWSKFRNRSSSRRAPPCPPNCSWARVEAGVPTPPQYLQPTDLITDENGARRRRRHRVRR